MTETVWLRARAPFAAYRWLQAGVYRGSAPTMTPTAAWGLVLNVAAIETRGALDGPVTPIRAEAPTLELAVGELAPAETSTLYQQLHSYPVGSSGKELAARVHGQKYWIAPVKREVLIGLDCIIGVRGPYDVLDRVRLGATGELDAHRYGIPFAGDNSFFFERLELVEPGADARWYTPVTSAGPAPGSARLTVSIDRIDSSRSVSRLFMPSAPAALPPDEAWQRVGPPAETSGRTKS